MAGVRGVAPTKAHPLTYSALGAGAFLVLYLPQPILPLLDRDLHSSPTLTGLLMTFGLLGFAVSGFLPEGDPRRSLKLAILLILVSSAGAVVAPNLYFLLPVRAAQGIGVGLLIAGGLADVARRMPAHRAGRYTGALVAGTAIGGLLSRMTGYSALFFGWRAAFAAGALGTLVLAGLAIRSLPPELAEQDRQPAGSVRAPVALVLAGLGILFVNIAVFDLLPYRLEGPPFHLPAVLADLVYFAFLPATLAAGIAGRGVDRLGARRVILLSCAFGLVLILSSLATSVLTTALAAVGSICCTVGLHVAHSGAAAAHGRRAVGRYLAAYYVGGAAAAPLAAAAFQRWGWIGMVIPVCAALVVVGSLAIFSPPSRWRPGGPADAAHPAALASAP